MRLRYARLEIAATPGARGDAFLNTTSFGIVFSDVAL
jgi:hypothetical protein